VVAQKILVRVHVGVDGRGVRCGSVAHPIGELRPRAPPWAVLLRQWARPTRAMACVARRRSMRA
jgi:hypothetical protein